jgi:hypothetical protein
VPANFAAIAEHGNKNNAKAKKTYMYAIGDFCIFIGVLIVLNDCPKILHFSQNKKCQDTKSWHFSFL